MAVPLLLRSHTAYKAVVRSLGDDEARPAEHALTESYSVLTRLPEDARRAPQDAKALLEDLGPVVAPAPTTRRSLLRRLVEAGVSGGAVYDALVGLAAADRALPLLTRDGRALPTYRALGIEVRLVDDA